MRVVRTNVDPSLGDRIGRINTAGINKVAGLERIIATGGEESTFDNYKLHQFFSSGDLIVYEPGWADVFLVGAGGNGGLPYYGGTGFGYSTSGGGGGGEVKQTRIYLDRGTYKVTVGSGASSIGSLISAAKGEDGKGIDGGDSGNGFIGGSGHPVGNWGWGCGGGAGASQNGGSVFSAGGNGADGGIGIASDFTGVMKAYAGGGGGGGGHSGGEGKYGGGNGGCNGAGEDGQANSGGGGGGAGNAPYGGAGGTGFVAIKYITNTNGYYVDAKVAKGAMNYSYIPKMLNNNTDENYFNNFIVGMRTPFNPTPSADSYKFFNKDWNDYIQIPVSTNSVYYYMNIIMDKPVRLWKIVMKVSCTGSTPWADNMYAALFYGNGYWSVGSQISDTFNTPSGSTITHTSTFPPTEKVDNYTIRIWGSGIDNQWSGRLYEVELYPYFDKYIRV